MSTEIDGKPNGAHLNGAHTNPADVGDDDSDAASDSPESEDEATNPNLRIHVPAPEVVAELAASCARFVLAKYGVPLDGTSDTLSILDQYVRDARGDLLIQPAGLPLLEATIGAYFGEVLRRAFDATWFASGDHDAWRLDFQEVYLTFNPVGMAREALTLGEADGWHAHLEMDEAETGEVLSRLARLPDVSDDEYYAPSTRFDVVELAVEALRARAHAEGLGDVRFTEEDYRRK
jgi:hypothetical protein